MSRHLVHGCKCLVDSHTKSSVIDSKCASRRPPDGQAVDEDSLEWHALIDQKVLKGRLGIQV
eukprot:scaffold78790_cov29-Tisochrysis_lutea.AAC.2